MFDPKCLDLAEYFLPRTASERLKAGLAQAIQDAVESYVLEEADRLETEIGLKPSGKPQ